MRVQIDPELVARQHGVVAHRQLIAMGFRPQAIQRMVAAGYLIVLHRGVYAVGHAQLRIQGRWMAAVLACGPEAVLSDEDAAAAFGWQPHRDGRIHVTTPRRSGRRAPAGVALHRVRSLAPWQTTEHDGIPITSPARTLLDLARRTPVRRLEAMIAVAVQQWQFDRDAVLAVLEAHPHRAGAPRLREVLERLHGGAPAPTRSPAEDRFLQLCDDHGLPTPSVNHAIGEFTIDAVWEAARLAVEVDSWTHHRTRTSFEGDRERDQVLAVAGYRVVRITAVQLRDRPDVVAGRLRALLDGSGSI